MIRKSMILRIGLVILVLVAAFLIFATTRPNTLFIQRSVTVNATPDKIFPLLNDFHNWPVWASQDLEDRTMTRTYSGAASGIGAVSSWTSRGDAGRGQMAIKDSQQLSRLLVSVNFAKPMALHNTHDILLESAGKSTRVTWTAHMQNPYFMKLLGVFVDMDDMMGKHFQASLDNLKRVAEK